MDILLLLIPVTLFLITVGGLLFWWTVKTGQYDDLDSPAHRILFDDDEHLIPKPNKKRKEKSND